MSDFVLCSTAPNVICRPIFCLSVSGWIDRTNIGDPASGIATHPPAGVRLRWNCPFLGADPAGREGYPSRFRILRTKDLKERNLVRRAPTAGQLPRTFAPPQLWHRVGMNGAEAYVGSDPCDRADGVYFELDSRASPVEATLIDTSGLRSIAIDLQPGDRFYYEVADLHGVSFSSRPDLTGPVEFLDLRGDLEQLDLNPHVIATVDARAWLRAPLSRVTQRIANAAGEPYVNIDQRDWSALAARGADLIAKHEAGQPIDQTELDAIAMAAAARWDAATLMGWGFVDGEHPAHQSLDQVDFAAMMHAGSNGIHGYQVIAEFDASTHPLAVAIGSTLQFVSSAPEGALTAVTVRALTAPRATVHTVNAIVPGNALDQPKKVSAPEEQVFCRTSYLVATRNPENERVFITPMASASVTSGSTFQPLGMYEQGAGDPAVRIEGMERRLMRRFDYQVPFVDSTVWLDVTVGDHWDRRLRLPSTPPQGLDLSYDGTAPPLAKAICDASTGLVNATLNSEPPWRADLLARLAGGRVEVMARNPATTRLEVEVKAGPAFLFTGQKWGATIDPGPNLADQDKLIGGLFSAGTFNSSIIGFATTPAGQLVCEFDANPHCAGEQLYGTVNGVTRAVLREAEDAPRLWSQIAEIPLDARSVPTNNSISGPITGFAKPPDWAPKSATFWFATRMVITIGGRTWPGPLSTPVSAPYLHPAPLPPTLCLNVQRLGTDFYGRALVRVSAENCQHFDPELLVTISGAVGHSAKPADASALEGIFQAQSAFQDLTVFEGFEQLARAAEGDAFTLEISYVRTSDGASSTPTLKEIIAKATGD